MSRSFYVKGLIFGILRCVASDIKMLRSKFLAKMVNAKFAYQNTGPVCIYYSSVFIHLFQLRLLQRRMMHDPCFITRGALL